MVSVWTEHRDALLMEAMANGASFSEAGKAAGVTKDSANKRFQRIVRSMGRQAT